MAKPRIETESELTESAAQADESLFDDMPDVPDVESELEVEKADTTKETSLQDNQVNLAATGPATKKAKKRRKVRKSNIKKSKAIKPAAKKKPIKKKRTRARKRKVKKTHLLEPDVSVPETAQTSTPDLKAAADSIVPKEPDKEPETIDRSNVEELKQESPTIEETPAGTISEGEIQDQAPAGQVSEEKVDSENVAAEQGNAGELKQEQPDALVPGAVQDSAPDPNAVADSVNLKEPDNKSDTAEGKQGEELKQEQPSVEEIPAEKANEKDTQEQATPDETSDDSEMGEVSEAIRKLTQSSEVLPEESQMEETGHHAECPTVDSTASATDNLFEMCANDIMQNHLTWASPDDSLQQAFAKMQQTDAGYIIIGQHQVLEGIVSKSDITKAMSPYLLPIFAKWRRPLDDATLKIRIKWIMSRPVRTIKPETPLATIMENMNQFRGRCLPVMDEEGNVQGLVTAFDIFRALLKGSTNTCSEEDRTVAELVEPASPDGTT